MAQNDLFTDTTIDLGRLHAAVGAARRPALAVALVVGLVAAGLAGLRSTPVAIESRFLVEPLAATRKPGDADRIVADQIGLLRAEDFLRRVAAARPANGEGSDRAAVERVERDLAVLQSGFTVDRLDRSRILALRLATSDEADGRRLLGALRDHWTAALAETRDRAEAEVDRRFAAEIDAAKRRLDAAEAETAVPAEAAAPVVSDLDALRAERAGADAVLQRLRDFAGKGADGVERAVDAAPTAGLQDLRRKRGLLRSRLAELSITYLGNHPLMKQVNADLDDLRAEMRAELPRAVAAVAAQVADLDRRIAERAAETTGSLPDAAAPTADLATPRADLDAVLARRNAARRAAVERVGVAVRALGEAEVEATASPVFVASVGIGGAVAAFLFGFAGFVGRGLRRPVPTVEATDDAVVAPAIVSEDAAPAAIAAPDDACPAPSTAVEAALRVEKSFVDHRGSAARLMREIQSELGTRARIVVVSIGDPARAAGAARALVAAGQGDAGLVDLSGLADPAVAGLADLLDGEVTFSEAIHRDPELDAWMLAGGARPLDDVDLVDPALAASLDACALAWGGVVIAAGRLEAGEGQTALFVGADAIVIAENDGADPRVARVLDVFLEAGRPAWVLEPAPADEADEMFADPETWAAAA